MFHWTHYDISGFPSAMTTFCSHIFPVEQVELAGTVESVLVGGRHLRSLIPQAFQGVDEIGVIGWGSQARAQAANLRDSLVGTSTRVVVGLQQGSPSASDARECGFTEEDGTLGEMYEVIARSDLVLLLISDAAQATVYPQVFAALQPGATLGLSHGFLLGYLHAIGVDVPSDINVIGVCPKGMGPSVRRLYEQGDGGAGINCSFAVAQDIDGWATDLALAWAVGIGAPCTFRTTLEQEYRSDVFGERGVLLGGLHGLVESLYRLRADTGIPAELAFRSSCETLTGPIRQAISRDGLKGLYGSLSVAEQSAFGSAYNASYGPLYGLLAEIYEEVDSGREIASVVAAGARLNDHPMPQVEGTPMWEVAARVRAARTDDPGPIDPVAAGLFAAMMMAQADLLRSKGHVWSEIANESVIEAVDSLIPYMHARGVAHMVDNCSVTARLGARRWGPVFEATLSRAVLPRIGGHSAGAPEGFIGHPLHDVLSTLGRFRPSIDIALIPEAAPA
ncbi:MAG: ketol-acid reductoisomerase [Actinomycetota bacterium]|jgi:ketol-acid reductoisomerase|nr:ketol-acid reductoisomerase [Actinomycetota bacterium]